VRFLQAGQNLRAQLDAPPAQGAPPPPSAPPRGRYANSPWRLTRLVFARQVLLTRRGRAFYLARMAQVKLLTIQRWMFVEYLYA
jgi:hypothetical protein